MDYAITSEYNREHGFETVEQKLRELMKEEGFGVLTEVDVKATMKEKLDLDKNDYKILGFCNPPRANKVLDVDGDIGIFLPCSGVVYDTGHSIRVALTNASSMFKMIGNEDVEPVANEVSEIFNHVKSKLDDLFQSE